MGNDGGSIPKRNELVKEKQKEVRPDQNAVLIATWFFCALSKVLYVAADRLLRRLT
jgi:hypothetical protein